MKNIRVFLSENFQFLAVKFSIYLNRRVFRNGLDPATSAYLDQAPQLAVRKPSDKKQTIISEITIQIYLHVGRQRIMSTQIRRRILLRLIGVYTIHGKPANLSKMYTPVTAIKRTRLGTTNAVENDGVTRICSLRIFFYFSHISNTAQSLSAFFVFFFFFFFFFVCYF